MNQSVCNAFDSLSELCEDPILKICMFIRTAKTGVHIDVSFWLLATKPSNQDLLLVKSKNVH
ncbi:TPA: hypothetical protein DDY55_04610 [Candidatus Falkowbacteria bacterium]|nr:hypothetical protein [Candidatus Falkowbacteria bacterium]HAY12207.1 hypothetical protein [Candidatus Falkowbacteria bacterium]HBI97368.1 hypothetical protein [Candidatus Falkowbacteria bacterium]HBT28111.1 hypothetical protein [Candidatus Falkowbacteria bacterium]HBY14575.1 hypothetical protein [Candidatus Falkowbacteria bacterium]